MTRCVLIAIEHCGSVMRPSVVVGDLLPLYPTSLMALICSAVASVANRRQHCRLPFCKYDSLYVIWENNLFIKKSSTPMSEWEYEQQITRRLRKRKKDMFPPWPSILAILSIHDRPVKIIFNFDLTTKSNLLKMLICKHYDTLNDKHPPSAIAWCINMTQCRSQNCGIKKNIIKTWDQGHINLSLIMYVSTLASVAISVTVHQCGRSIHGVYSCPQCEILPQCILCASHTAIGGWMQCKWRWAIYKICPIKSQLRTLWHF